MIRIKERTKLNLQISRNNLRIHVRSKTENSVRDSRIRAAMRDIHPQSDNPWLVSRFLTEIAEPESEIIFEVMDKGNNS